MRADKRKVVIVGTGMVGMSYAYCLLNQSVCDELVLIDVNKKRAEGEAMDLNHGLAFANSSMTIYAGEYDDCSDADIVVICAGVAQKQGETRLDLLKRNAEVFRSIIEPVTSSGFNGLILVATNPVDIMTRITCTLSGFNPRRVLGTGTALDTARLRYLLGDYLKADPRNVHAYVMGEHGDSELAVWSSANVAGIDIHDFCELRGHYEHDAAMERIYKEVRDSAYEIIERKGATYYGVAMAVGRIAESIIRDENSVLPVSSLMEGEYGLEDLCISVPTLVSQKGAEQVLEIPLDEKEHKKLRQAAAELKKVLETLDL